MSLTPLHRPYSADAAAASEHLLRDLRVDAPHHLSDVLVHSHLCKVEKIVAFPTQCTQTARA